jgi:hypothetical protein
MQRAERIGFSHVHDVLQSLNLPGFPAWRETRGRKKKYTFYHLQKGEIQKIIVPLKRARAVQTAMKRAANKEKVKITIQNHGAFLLIKRTV